MESMISVVVPCYNAEKTINRTINSLRNQTEKRFQIVLVDDGSNDGTSQLCDEYSQNDPRVKVIHQKNRGLMGAWKQGVIEADGQYIAFCDADDYVDADFIERVGFVVNEYSPDIIVFGMMSEYPNGDIVRSYNVLNPGCYDERDIKELILPKLLSDGSMESQLIIKSRCSKVFKKSILLRIIPALDEKISLGEDQLTMFASVQIAKSLFCMGDYCPYHYIRTPESMIGQFDPLVFNKIDNLYEEMNRLSLLFSYDYPDQVLYDRLSVTLVYLKKYICKSTGGFQSIRPTLCRVRNSTGFIRCIEKCSIGGYSRKSRFFLLLFIKRYYYLMFFITKMLDSVRGRVV